MTSIMMEKIIYNIGKRTETKKERIKYILILNPLCRCVAERHTPDERIMINMHPYWKDIDKKRWTYHYATNIIVEANLMYQYDHCLFLLSKWFFSLSTNKISQKSERDMFVHLLHSVTYVSILISSQLSKTLITLKFIT